MLRVLPMSALILAACEPPPPVSGGGADEVGIAILYPPSDVGQIALGADGVLRLLVVTDIDGLEFVPPSETTAAVEGEGHYHVTLNSVYQGAPDEQFYEYASDPLEFPPGTAMSLRVSLANGAHEDLDEFDDWEAIVEFQTVAASVE